MAAGWLAHGWTVWEQGHAARRGLIRQILSPNVEDNTSKLLAKRLSALEEVEIPKQDHVKSKDEKVVPGGGDTHLEKGP